MKKYELTDEHRAQLKPWADRWITNALSNRRIGSDMPKVVTYVRALYKAADLEPPPRSRVVRCDGPVSGAIAAGFAATVWRLRETTSNKYTDEDYRQAVSVAVTKALGGASADLVRVAQTSKVVYLAANIKAERVAETNNAIVKELLASTNDWSQMVHGGSTWSGWASYLSFFRVVAELPIDYTNWLPYEALAELSGVRYMHDKFTIVCERHTEVHRDEQSQPHCETGPAIAWADGYSRYYWHGTNVPPEWIEQKDLVDPSLALTHDNIEQRRALCEILTWERVLSQLNHTVLNTDNDPEIGALISVQLPDAGDSKFLRVKCGTGRFFCLPVPDEVTTAIGAQAWMWQMSEAEYRLLEART